MKYNLTEQKCDGVFNYTYMEDGSRTKIWEGEEVGI